MPIFEYLCCCGQKFEELVGVVAAAPVNCPKCGESERVTKLISRFAHVIPAWMTDAGMEATAKQREWLKSDAAKAMDLNLSRGEGDEFTEPEPVSLGPSPDEMLRDFINGGMPAPRADVPLEKQFEEIADRAGHKLDMADDPIQSHLEATANA